MSDGPVKDQRVTNQTEIPERDTGTFRRFLKAGGRKITRLIKPGRSEQVLTGQREEAEQANLREKQRELNVAAADAEVEASLEDLPGETLLDLSEAEMRALITENPQRLTAHLANTRLYRTDSRGAYLHLYSITPEAEGPSPLAVKVFDTNETMFSKTSSLEAQTDDAELQAAIDPPSNIIFVDKQNPQLGDLSPTDRQFLLLAMEHAKHEEFYGDFVKPAVFVAYPSPYADWSEPLDSLAQNPNAPVKKIALQNMIDKGIVTSDYRRIYHKRGEMLYTMVQEFVDMGPSVFTLDPKSFTSDQKNQLKRFAEIVESVYESEGYFPDTNMSKPSSGNLRFDKDGKLVLIDTNLIEHSAETGNHLILLDELKRLYED